MAGTIVLIVKFFKNKNRDFIVDLDPKVTGQYAGRVDSLILKIVSPCWTAVLFYKKILRWFPFILHFLHFLNVVFVC